MINPINVTGVQYTVDERTEKYIIGKIGKLDRFIPRAVRKETSAHVVVKFADRKDGNVYEVSVVIETPGKTFKSDESTGNVLAAIDIIEKKLDTQIKKHKEIRTPHEKNHGLMAKFKRSFGRELD